MMDWDGNWSNHMDGAWVWLGGAMMIAFMALAIVTTVALVLWVVRASRVERTSPRDVIDGRYAQGEIDEARRQEMIETLS